MWAANKARCEFRDQTRVIICFSVGTRGDTYDLPKDLRIITGSTEATSRSNGCNREIVVYEKRQTFLDAVMQQVLKGRLMEGLLEETTTLAAAHETRRCNVM